MEITLNKKLTRMLGGDIPMNVFVETIDTENNSFTVNKEDSKIPKGEGWTFCLKTGMEIDKQLQWGPNYKRTGSYIKGFPIKYIKENTILHTSDIIKEKFQNIKKSDNR